MNYRPERHRRHWGMLLIIMTLALWQTGCALAPGGHIKYRAGKAPLHDAVDIKPITPELVHTQALEIRRQKQALSQNRLAPTEMPASYDYLIGRGDVLNIIVYDHPELTIPAGSERSAADSGNVVHSDGTIFYPYVGQVDVAGRTVRDVRDEIQRRLSSYISKPQVDVKVAVFNAQKAYVTGQVENPGTYPITNIPMRVLDVLGLAGGLNETANWHQVTLSRDGEERILSVYNMLNQGDLQQNVLIRHGDVIHVPETANQQVYVMGEVMRPAAFGMGGSPLSLTNALAQAGGIRETSANASGIFVVRRNPEPSDKIATVYQLNARNATAFMLGSEFMLQPTDVVYVTAAPISRWNRVLSQLLPSLTSIYQTSQVGRNIDYIQSNN